MNSRISHANRDHMLEEEETHNLLKERDLVLVLLEETHILLHPVLHLEDIETTRKETDMCSISSNINQNT